MNAMQGLKKPAATVLKRKKKFELQSQPLCYDFEDLVKTPMVDRSLIPRPLLPSIITSISTPPTIPVLLSQSTEKEIGHARSSLSSRHKPGHPRKASQHSLPTIVERNPEIYQPTYSSNEAPANLSNYTFEYDKMISEPSMMEQEHPTIKADMESAVSHPSYSVIRIQPSPQLASMQAIGEHVQRTGDTSPYGTRTRSKVFTTQSQLSLPHASYIPTGSPRAVFKKFEEIEKSSSNHSRLAYYVPRIAKVIGEKDWVRASEGAHSNTSLERSTDWIEGFLARREEADRLEEAKQKQEKMMKWNLTRTESFKRIKRRLSGKRAADFEPRQERSTISVRRPSARTSPARSDKIDLVHPAERDKFTPPEQGLRLPFRKFKIQELPASRQHMPPHSLPPTHPLSPRDQ